MILCVLVVGGGFYLALDGFVHSDSLPAGRYPVFLFFIPALLAACVVFVIGRVLLRLTGMRFWRDER